MSLTQIAAPYPIFTDTDGTPLDDGYLYIGEVSKNPETNPIAVYWDPEFKFPAAQPIRTNNGYPWRMGTPALLYADGQFSITVRNKKRDLVVYAPVGFGINPSAVAGGVIKNDFVGDGSRIQFAIGASPATPLAVNVFINGAYQEKDTYTVAGNIVTFTEAPPANCSIEIITIETGVIGSTNATLVSYQPSGSGAVGTNVQEKLNQFVTVFDFMTQAEIEGVQDGSQPDVTSAIQAALASATHIYFPPGQYKITAPINWEGQWLIGAVDNGELSTGANQSMIIADGTFPAFRYYNQYGYNSHGGGIKNFNVVFANGLIPSSPLERPNAVGVLISGNDGYPAFYSIENVTVRGGMWACFDQSGAWMATYKHVQSQHNFAGFYKRYGTTINYENCYHNGGFAGWHITDCIGVSMDACAFDMVSSNLSPSYFPMFVENSNVVVNGGDFEANTLEGDFAKLIFANGANGQLQFNGSRFIFTSIGDPSIGAENYLVFADGGAKVTMTGVDFSTPVRTGANGAVFYSVAKNYSVVTWKNCNIPQFGGSGGTAYSGQGYSGGTVDYDGTKFYYPWSMACYQQEKAIKFSTVYNPASVPANSSITAAFTVVGAQTGDYVYCVFEWPTYGIIIDSFVTAADEITVVFYNITAAPIDLPEATLRLSVVKKFYSQ